MKWGASYLLPWLWLLLPIAWLLILLVRRREKRLTLLADASVLPVLSPARAPGRVRARIWLWLLAIALAGTALARPQWGFHWEEVRRRSLDILVVLDSSRSMQAEDIKPNRLQQAKWGIRDLVKLLKGDRVGLVTFAGSSFLQCPLTSDYAAFLMGLEDVYIGIIPKGGTAIGQALQTAVDSFEGEADSDRVIVLITDGEDHAGNLDEVREALAEEKIKVFAVGVGTLEGELIPDTTESGERGYLKDREGLTVKTALQESELERLAVSTGGMYVRSKPGDLGLERIVERGLSQLTRSEKESRMVKAFEERFQWLLGLAFLCFCAEAVLMERTRTPGATS